VWRSGSAGGTTVAYTTYEKPSSVSVDPEYTVPIDSGYATINFEGQYEQPNKPNVEYEHVL